MFNFVFSGFDAKIKINDSFFNVNKNELQPVNNNFENITVFAPHCKQAFFVPYTISKSECLTYTHKALNTKIYSLKPNYFLKQNYTAKIETPSKISANFVTRGKCFLKVSVSDQAYTECFAELCENPQTINSTNFLIVYAKNILCDGFSVLVFNLSTKSFCFNKSVYEIKEQNNQICFLDYPVLTGAAKATIYNLSADNFTATETYYVKLFKPQVNAVNVPLLLFYAIKTKDFNYAKSLLCPSLATSATNEMLENYFLPYSDMYKSPFKDNAYILVDKTCFCDIDFNLTNNLLVDNFNKN